MQGLLTQYDTTVLSGFFLFGTLYDVNRVCSFSQDQLPTRSRI